MQRNVLTEYYPHALLALAATASLCFVVSRPSAPDQRATYTTATRQETRADDFVDRNHIHANARTRSLAEVFANARLKYHRNRHDHTNAEDQADPQTISPAYDETEIALRRMIRQRDIRSLSPVANSDETKHIGYASPADLTLRDAPEALPQREYQILAYGEIGGTEPVVPTRAAGSSTHPVSGKNQDAEADIAFVADAQGRGNLVSPVVPAVSAVIPATPSGPSERGVTEPMPVATTNVTAPPAYAAPVSAAAAQTTTANEKTAASVESAASQTTSVYAGHMAAQTPASTDALQTVAPRVEHAAKPETTAKKSGLGSGNAVAFAGEPADSRPGAQASTPSAQGKVTGPINTTPSQAAKPTPRANDPFNRDRDDHANQSLVMLIDGSDTLGSDKLNAIDNAIKQINQAAQKANLGIELKTTTDKNAGHNILLKEDNGKDMGNKLGLAEFTVTEDKHGKEMYLGESLADMGGIAKISINKVFDWFAGDDGKSIGKNQYDYQTAITHEILHMIGLDDDFENHEAVSYGLLSPGEIRRNIDTHEIKELASIFQSANPWRSVSTLAQLSKNNGKLTYKSKALTAAVPEPASLVLAVVGLLGVCRHRRR